MTHSGPNTGTLTDAPPPLDCWLPCDCSEPQDWDRKFFVSPHSVAEISTLRMARKCVGSMGNSWSSLPTCPAIVPSLMQLAFWPLRNQCFIRNTSMSAQGLATWHSPYSSLMLTPLTWLL